MEPEIFYKTRVNELERELKKLQQKKSGFGWLRFGSIAAIVAAFYVFWSLGAVYRGPGHCCFISSFYKIAIC